MQLVKDDDGDSIQIFGLPVTGKNTDLASAVGSAATASLTAGVYRISTDIDARICSGATASATDMPIKAGSAEYFYLNAAPLAAYCAATGGKISATLIN